MNKNDKTDRFFFVPAMRLPICRTCTHYTKKTTCKAFPNGIPDSVFLKKEKDRDNPAELVKNCGNSDFHYCAK